VPFGGLSYHPFERAVKKGYSWKILKLGIGNTPMAEAMYTPHPLDGAFERVRRAEEHLLDLRPRIEAMRQQQAHYLLTQFDGRPLDQLWLPGMVQASMRIPILVGETCYNLRSALEYLVFELAKHDSGVPQKKTQFPIVDTPEKFRPDRLKEVNAAHVAAIERLQPYNGCDWTRALREVSNPDKHREFVQMRGTGTGLVYTPTDPEYASLALPICRAQHPATGETDVKVDFTCSVQFADGPPVIETLELIKLRIFETLTAFKTEFN
jgi:hypothetical protein